MCFGIFVVVVDGIRGFCDFIKKFNRFLKEVVK